MKAKLSGIMLGLGAAISAPLAWAGDALPEAAQEADVVILGEVHDNPAHHAVQADWVAALAPRAVVFEMLTEAQAGADTPGLRADQAALDAALGWSDGGWDAFDMYYPVLAASEARFYGAAVPRAQLRAAYGGDVIALFGAGAADYGLTDALPDAQLAARLDLQYEAHCEAMPRDSLGGMVEIQRLRDATLARAVLRALEEQGPPVAVVTGNGHARRDWGVPSYLARVAPGVSVFVLGQSEGGRDPEGGFDLILDAPAVDRPDPCAVFRKSE